MTSKKRIETRLEALEKTNQPQEDNTIFVYHGGEDGLLRRTNAAGEVIETITQAEFDALPGRKITVSPSKSDENSEED